MHGTPVSMSRLSFKCASYEYCYSTCISRSAVYPPTGQEALLLLLSNNSNTRGPIYSGVGKPGVVSSPSHFRPSGLCYKCH